MDFIKLLTTCAEIIGLEFSDELLLGGKEELARDVTVKRLLNCANSVLDSLYRSYSRISRNTVIQVVNGFAETESLKLIKVNSLTDSCGNAVKFRYRDNGLLVDTDGRYNLSYVHAPAEITVDSQIILPSPRISERIFVYGVIAEYYTLTGDLTLAAVWNDKYLNALQVLSLSVTSVMPVRGWL